MSMLEACIREDLNEHAPRAMAVLHPVKVVIENLAADEVLSCPGPPEQCRDGYPRAELYPEIFIDEADFKEEANKQFKRLVLGKEVRLRNAYVIKAERIEKDADGKVTASTAPHTPRLWARIRPMAAK
ncbi:hypothetical protein ACNKHX_03905 [Shigella flexneri]